MPPTTFGSPAVPFPDGPGRGYPLNSHGQSYGSAADAVQHGGEPDLIAVCASNGRLGYVRRTDLHSPPPISPEAAVAGQLANAGRSKIVPVYDRECESVVGEFVMGPAGDAA
jgi:hypothetical protein